MLDKTLFEDKENQDASENLHHQQHLAVDDDYDVDDCSKVTIVLAGAQSIVCDNEQQLVNKSSPTKSAKSAARRF